MRNDPAHTFEVSRSRGTRSVRRRVPLTPVAEAPAWRPLVLPIQPQRIVRVLAILSAAFLVVSIGAGLYAVNHGGPALRLEPGVEGSPLTWLGSTLLFSIALSCAALGARGHSLAEPTWWRWWVPALVAVGMSFDEVVAGHEALETTWLLLLAGPVGLAVAVICWPLWRAEPRREQVLWVVAGGLYGLGVFIVDALPRVLLDGSVLTVPRVLLHGLEEGLELAGLLVLILALLGAAVRAPDA